MKRVFCDNFITGISSWMATSVAIFFYFMGYRAGYEVGKSGQKLLKKSIAQEFLSLMDWDDIDDIDEVSVVSSFNLSHKRFYRINKNYNKSQQEWN